MSFLSFCKINGIEGESQNKAHKDWIGLLSYTNKLTQRGGAEQGMTTGHPGGKTEVDEFKITKRVDKSSPYLAQSCASGDPISSVVVEVSFANKDEAVFMRYTMSKAIIASVAVDGDVSDDKHLRPVETITFRFSHIAWEYIQHGDDGKPIGGTVKTKWNVAQHAVSDP